MFHEGTRDLPRPLFDDVDGIVGRYAIVSEAGDVVFWRMLMRVDHQPVNFSDRLIAKFRNPHTSQMNARPYPLRANDSGQRIRGGGDDVGITYGLFGTLHRPYLRRNFLLHFFCEGIAIAFRRAVYVYSFYISHRAHGRQMATRLPAGTEQSHRTR